MSAHPPDAGADQAEACPEGQKLSARLSLIENGAQESLAEANRARESALESSRGLVRASANCIRALHRGETASAGEAVRRAGALAAELLQLADARADVFHTGYVQDSLKEFAEARCVFALFHEEPLPGAAELGIPWPAYLNGLGESVGEMRRHCLDLLRCGEVESAGGALDAMDAIFSVLVSIDYPDALTGGLRRTADMARGILERTRADLATAVAQQRLAGDIERLLTRLGPMSAGAGRPATEANQR